MSANMEKTIKDFRNEVREQPDAANELIDMEAHRRYQDYRKIEASKVVQNFIDSQTPLEPEFAKIINDNFWDLVLK